MKSLSLAALLTAATLALSSAASAATVGDPAIDRAQNDSFSNFGFAFAADVFDTGKITSWTAFTGNAGNMGLMVLDVIAPNQFEIAEIDIRTVTAGLNTFATSIKVSAGQILGLYQGTAKVDFDFAGTSGHIYSANGVLGTSPSTGFNFTGAGSTNRIYSINANVEPVPLPAGLPLMLAGLGAFAVVRRRATKA